MSAEQEVGNMLNYWEDMLICNLVSEHVNEFDACCFEYW
jgi:hypothetical protein